MPPRKERSPKPPRVVPPLPRMSDPEEEEQRRLMAGLALPRDPPLVRVPLVPARLNLAGSWTRGPVSLPLEYPHAVWLHADPRVGLTEVARLQVLGATRVGLAQEAVVGIAPLRRALGDEGILLSLSEAGWCVMASEAVTVLDAGGGQEAHANPFLTLRRETYLLFRGPAMALAAWVSPGEPGAVPPAVERALRA